MMAMATVARGTTMFIETIFQNRYRHVDELCRFGANIKVEERVAIVEGVDSLYAAEAQATDLRGGAALVIAALAAHGESKIGNIRHIDRGYAELETDLQALGAHIKRVDY